MTDPSFTPESDRELVAVYADRATAERAGRAVQDAGVPPDHVHLDEDLDAVLSLQGEMHEELSGAWVVPNAGVAYPKEAARGLVLASMAGVALGILAAFPLALIDVGGTYWVRWVVFAVVGGAFGATVALVVGPASSAPRPDALPAAARGSVVRIEDDTAEVRRVLVSHGPLRIDEVTPEGQPLDTVFTERPDSFTETAKDMAANTEGDDYHEQR